MSTRAIRLRIVIALGKLVTRPPYSKQETARIKLSIVVAAFDLFAANGANKLSFRRVADRTGMSHATIYSYFKNKQSLLEALQVEMLRILQHEMEEADDPDAPPLERLRIAGRSLLKYAKRHPKYYQFLFTSSFEEKIARETLLARHAVFEFVVKIADLAAHEGAIEMEPRTLANLAWATLHGLIMLQLNNQLREGRTLSELAEAALDLLFATSRSTAHVLRGPKRRRPSRL